MSRRRLERGYWNGRQVKVTPKEYSRLFVFRTERGKWYHRHEMVISMDWPYPNSFETDFRLPRKTKKALWKHFNGHPETNPRSGVLAYNGWTWGIWWSTPGLLHKGRKPQLTPEAERLIEEGNAILATLDEFNEREEVERTMGSMATSSYRSDMFRRAMVKFDEALDVLKKGKIDE